MTNIGIYGGIYINRDLSRNDGVAGLGCRWELYMDTKGIYYMYRESLALLSTQYVGTYLGMMVWLGWDGNDPAAASSLSFPHMPTTLPIYRQVTLQKHTIMKYGVQISDFRIQNQRNSTRHLSPLGFPAKTQNQRKCSHSR